MADEAKIRTAKARRRARQQRRAPQAPALSTDGTTVDPVGDGPSDSSKGPVFRIPPVRDLIQVAATLAQMGFSKEEIPVIVGNFVDSVIDFDAALNGAAEPLGDFLEGIDGAIAEQLLRLMLALIPMPRLLRMAE